MKKIIYLILVSLFSLCAFGQARPGAYPWSVTFKVVDDSGQPVIASHVSVGYLQTGKIAGLTDSNGVFVATHTDRSFALGFLISKEGYYQDYLHYELFKPGQFDDQKVAANRNPTLTLTLKKIIRPIPMYAKSLNTHVPDLDKPVGYDLLVGDWVKPYGKGNNADINFTGHFDKSADGESDFTLTASFPKVGDGIQEFTVPEAEKESGLRSPHEAPIDGYKFQWIQTDNRKPNKPILTNRDPNRNYFFRVQTILDAQGRVKSALYGKIYGDFMEFIFYLNPTPNDRNVEFDPKHNLMKNLNEFEGVNRP